MRMRHIGRKKKKKKKKGERARSHREIRKVTLPSDGVVWTAGRTVV